MDPVTLLVVGAAYLGSYKAATMPKDFDAVEYEQVVAVTVDATRAIHQCGKNKELFSRFLSDLNTSSLKLGEYVNHKAGKEVVADAVFAIRGLVLAFDGHETYSAKYCVHKLSEVQSGARTLARALGGLNKFDICESDVLDRYAFYQQSYMVGEITSIEYKELVSDLVKLGSVDKAGCSLESKAKLESAVETLSKVAAAIGK